ncbi:outer membrane lipoprotein-sorting protein [Candidatus Endoriftia persephonae]|jgi:hypothetical protein|uniref:Uncharacterized protein TP-0789 domain-containing protein n=2 Tax=Gammaproteobacteria TaxID=1236 RepID=G2FJN5_9GAMM|nr:outer membrane lipoprotein-sorting protein [Candidatus Endoriftia persephone]EGW52987.1 hypothetical protein TevJSym_bt00080 [endosymbiont of Tevnia jerichonana (vent Tica)]USF87978.1 outer membrane lipoprotein-sorting protein [Candidatus Endoriftia persephone]
MTYSRILLTALLLLLCWPLAAEQSDPEAIALLQKSETLMRSSGTIAQYKLEIIRPDWQRTMEFVSHDDYPNNRFRMEILSPRKTKGTVFLKIGDQLSMFLPKLRRQIAISPAMMHDAWMGSDFNNQDLLEANSLIDDYTHHITARQGEGKTALITITSQPKPNAKVSWSKLQQQIRGDGIPLSITYGCNDPTGGRQLKFEAVQKLGGRNIPTRMIMQPQGQPGRRTVITIKSASFNQPLDEALFAPQAKKK